MKKILFYFTSLKPAGGIERVISTLANRFSESMDVTILVKDDAYSHYTLKDAVKLISLESKLDFDMDSKLKRITQAGANFFKSSIKLTEFLAKNQFDIYYLAHPLNVLEFHKAQGIDNRVIITEHGAIDAYNIFYKKIKQWLYPKARVYVVPTTLDAQAYKLLGYPTKYIPHFRSELPYSYSIPDSKIALSIGRMTEAKRQWILIDLWDDIVNNHQIKDWQLHLVGEGNLKQRLIEKVASHHLQKYVKILPPIKNVEAYYEEASLFMLTSQSEGFGMVLLEAISFGLPCISYESPPGPRDIIDDDISGYLIPMDDYQKLKSATLTLMQDSQKLQKFSEHAFESSLKWTDDIVMEKWKTILY